MNNDERIMKGLNQIKGKVVVFVAISTLILGLIKLILGVYGILQYGIEIYILLVASILGLLRLTIFERIEDERIEQNYTLALNGAFLIILFGAFGIHFYLVSKAFANQTSFFMITSILMFIGSIYFVYLLRKNDLYLNYKIISLNKGAYMMKIITKYLTFSLLFLLNVIFFVINNNNILTGLLAIIISLISMGFYYIIFAIFEKNHYDEDVLVETGKRRGLSKNVALLYALPLIFSILYLIVGFYFFKDVYMNIGVYPDSNIININNQMMLYSINRDLWLLGAHIVIYAYIVKYILRLHTFAKYFKLYFVIAFVLSIISYIYLLIVNLNLINMDIDLIQSMFKVSNIFSNISFYLSICILLLFSYMLYEKKVSHIILVVAHALLALSGHMVYILALKNRSMTLALLQVFIYIGSYISLYVFYKIQDHKIIVISDESHT